jgi:hypothetical protein
MALFREDICSLKALLQITLLHRQIRESGQFATDHGLPDLPLSNLLTSQFPIQLVEQREATGGVAGLGCCVKLGGQIMLHQSDGRQFIKKAIDTGVTAAGELLETLMLGVGST